MLHLNSVCSNIDKIVQPAWKIVLGSLPQHENRELRGKSTKRTITPEITENNKRLRTPSPTRPVSPRDPIFEPLTYEDVYCSGVRYLSENENDDVEVRKKAFDDIPLIPQLPISEDRPLTPHDSLKLSDSDKKPAPIPKLMITKRRDFSAQTNCVAEFSYNFGTHTKTSLYSKLMSDRSMVDSECQTDLQVQLAVAQSSDVKNHKMVESPICPTVENQDSVEQSCTSVVSRGQRKAHKESDQILATRRNMTHQQFEFEKSSKQNVMIKKVPEVSKKQGNPRRKPAESKLQKLKKQYARNLIKRFK